MSTLRHVLTAAALAVIPLSLFPAIASAQYGWANLSTHLSGMPTTVNGGGFSAIYRKNSDGSETKLTSVEFPVGTYTLARVTGHYQNCDTEATNVTFSIVSGGRTFVDVPMSFTTCDIEFWLGSRAGGLGMIQVVDALNVIVAECRLALSNAGRVVYVEHAKRCHARLAYRANMRLIVTPLTQNTKTQSGDSLPVSSVFRPDTGAYGGSEIFIGQSVGTDAFPDEVNAQHPDLKLVRTGGTYGGQMVTAQFTLTNESAFRAQQVSVEKALEDSVFNSGYNVSLMTISYGNCISSGGAARCTIHQIMPGDTIQVAITQFNQRNTPGNQTPYCTSVVAVQPRFTGTPPFSEIDTTNNRQPCRAANVQVAVALGGNSPISQPVVKGTSNAPMLQFSLNPASPQTLNSITLKASGTGNEQVDVTAVKLFVDTNANGIIDGPDVQLAAGAFATNDGTVTLSINPPYTVTGPTSFLVTYDFNTTIAPRIVYGFLLIFLPVCAAPLARRRKHVVAKGLALSIMLIGLASCGGSSGTTAPPVTPPTTSAATYQATLTGVNLSGFDVPGVSLAGATISVSR